MHRFSRGLFLLLPALAACAEGGAERPRWISLAPETAGGSPRVGHYAGEGFLVRAGSAKTIRSSLPPGSALRFFAVGEPSTEERRELAFRVELDGDVLFQETQVVRKNGTGRWHAVVLPAEGKEAIELRFSVEGDAARAAFLAPTIGPVETGDLRSRPWGSSRPSFVLFLADTFRADNLSFYGGDADLAPHLNALAEQSVRFARAWSPSSWTLPAQASMMTGLQPEQHTAVTRGVRLGGELVTLAEHLRAQGYRTGAVTEGLFLSPDYGFEQGFELFHENRRGKLANTLSSADSFLAADDGRPFFLFVQTYRTHSPYRVGAEEDSGPVQGLMERAREGLERLGGDGSVSVESMVPEWRRLYREGVRGLDELTGPWLDQLASAGFFEHGYLFFTSDHGEAFHEHGKLGHGGRHWEERIRIPLLVRGPELAPRTIEAPATLLDLPVTFASLAGLPPHPSWGGRSLFDLPADRRIYTFWRGGKRRWLTVHEGDRKVYADAVPADVREGVFNAAYDLHADPREQNDLASEPPEWVPELLRTSASDIDRLLRPVIDPEANELSERMRRELQALGYGGVY